MLNVKRGTTFFAVFLAWILLSGWPLDNAAGHELQGGLIQTKALFAAVARLQEETRNPSTTASDVALGAKTFRSHCSPCHGMSGEGGRGPNLAAGNFFHGGTDAELLRIVSEGIAGTEMPGLFYSPDRVWQVVAYIRSLSTDRQVPATADAARGEKLYQSRDCRQCHRIQGEGGRLGPDLTDIGRTRSFIHLRESLVDPDADVRQRYWVVSYTGTAGDKVEGFLMNEDTYTVQFIDMTGRLHSVSKEKLKDYKVAKVSKMPSYKASLSERELDDLAAYLASLRPKGGVQ